MYYETVHVLFTLLYTILAFVSAIECNTRCKDTKIFPLRPADPLLAQIYI